MSVRSGGVDNGGLGVALDFPFYLALALPMPWFCFLVQGWSKDCVLFLSSAKVHLFLVKGVAFHVLTAAILFPPTHLALPSSARGCSVGRPPTCCCSGVVYTPHVGHWKAATTSELMICFASSSVSSSGFSWPVPALIRPFFLGLRVCSCLRYVFAQP